MVEESTVRIAVKAATEAAQDSLNEVEQELEDVGKAGGEAAAGATRASQGIDRLKQKAGEARQNLAGMGRTMTRVGKQATVGVTLPLAAAGGMSLKLASDAEEMRSKMGVVFGDLTGDIEAWASSHAQSINRSRFQLQKYATSLQDTFVPMGLARDRAADMSTKLSELAVDLASFNNVSESRSIKALQSGLVGNTEALRQFGIVITAAQVKQEAYNSGIAEQGEKLTEQQKLLARYNLILQGSEDAQGDAARTADSFKNQLRGLKAQAREAGINIGQKLMPVAKDLISRVIPLVRGFNNLSPRMQEAIVVLGGLAAAIPPVVVALGALSIAVGALSVPILAIIGAVAAVAAGLIIFRDELKPLIPVAKQLYQDVLKPLGKVLIGIAKDAIQFAAEQFAYLEDAIRPPTEALISELKPTLDALQPVIKRIAVGLKVMADVAKSILLPIVRALAGFFRVTLANAIAVVIGFVRVIMALMRGDFGKAFQIAKEVVLNSLGRIKEFILSWGIIEAIVGILKGVLTAIYRFFFVTLPGVIGKGLKLIVGTVTNAKRALENAFIGVWNGIINIAENFINGLIQRLEDFINNWIEGINTVVEQANRLPKVNVGEFGNVEFGDADFSGARLERRETGTGGGSGGGSGGGTTVEGDVNVNVEGGGDFGADPERNSRQLGEEMQRELSRNGG